MYTSLKKFVFFSTLWDTFSLHSACDSEENPKRVFIVQCECKHIPTLRSYLYACLWYVNATKNRHFCVLLHLNTHNSQWAPLAWSNFWLSMSLMVFSALKTFLIRVSSLRLIFFWSSNAQLITMAWNFWSMATGGASVTQAACRAIRRCRLLPVSSSNFLTISSIIDVAWRKASSCSEFLITPTETSTQSVRPRSRLDVRLNSSLSPEKKTHFKQLQWHFMNIFVGRRR